MLTQKLKTSIMVGGLVGMLVLPLSAHAQTVTVTPRGAQKAANQAAHLSALHAECDTQITNRITSLNTAASRVNGLVKLSSAQKAQFSGEITSDITALTSLKAKCDADTDITTLRADYRSIFTAYRVYAVFLPQLHLLVSADTMGVTQDKLSDLVSKLQTRIQKAGNPSNLTSLLSDMQAKIADAQSQTNSVTSHVTSLTPQMYDNDPTGTTSTEKNARTEIQSGAADLKAAFADAKQIIQALKQSTTQAPTK